MQRWFTPTTGNARGTEKKSVAIITLEVNNYCTWIDLGHLGYSEGRILGGLVSNVYNGWKALNIYPPPQFCCCRAETQALQRELAGLSERYSQKCLELNKAEQRNAEREREISHKERDMEQLKKENSVS